MNSLADCVCVIGFFAVNSDDDSEDDDDGSNSLRCDPCPVGTYKDTFSNEACIACPFSGSIAMTTASTNSTAMSECICSAGKAFSESNAATDNGFLSCVDCPVNFFCDGKAVDPVPCPLGTSTIGGGANDIARCLCDSGSTRDAETMECTLCTLGRYKPHIGDGICTNLCPEGATSSPGAIGDVDCFCEIGFYSSLLDDPKGRPRCIGCPAQGVYCPGNFTEDGQHRVPHAQVGHFLIHYSINAPKCVVQFGEVSVCGEENSCAEGQDGFLCGDCAPGHWRDKFPEICEPCPEPIDLVYGALGYFFQSLSTGFYYNLIATLAAAASTRQQKVTTTLIRIMTSFFAAVAVLAKFDLTRIPLFEWSVAQMQEQSGTCNTTEAEQQCDLGEDGLFTFSFPKEFDEAMRSLYAFTGVFPAVASPQQLFECGAMHWQSTALDDGKRRLDQLDPGKERSLDDDASTAYGRLSGLYFLLPAGYWAIAHVPWCVLCTLIAYAIARQTGMLKFMMSLSGPPSIEMIRPQLEPVLLRHHLTWDQFSKLATLFSQADLRHMIKAPDRFIEECIRSGSGMLGVKDFILTKAQSTLAPKIFKTYSVTWEDAVPWFKSLKSVDEIQTAISDPETFFAQLMRLEGSAAKTSQETD